MAQPIAGGIASAALAGQDALQPMPNATDVTNSPTPTNVAANPTPPTPAPAAPSKPSFFRVLLAGTLLGGAAGMGQRTPGAAAAAAASAVSNQRQQQVENEQRQQQITQSGQVAQAQVTEAQSRSRLDEAQSAKAIMDAMETSRNLQYLDKDKQAELGALQANTVKIYNDAGLQLLGTVKDDPADLHALMVHYQQTGQKITDPIVVHNSADGQVYLYRRDPTKVLDQSTADQLSAAYGIKLVPGMPMSSVNNIVQSKMAAMSAQAVANTDVRGRFQVAQQEGQNALKVAGLEMGTRLQLGEQTARLQEAKDLQGSLDSLAKIKADHELMDKLGMTPSIVDTMIKSNQDRLDEINAINEKGGKGGGGANQPPAGATMKVPGSDGKMHWSDGKHDLGVVQP